MLRGSAATSRHLAAARRHRNYFGERGVGAGVGVGGLGLSEGPTAAGLFTLGCCT
jgi:hypothetical protein